MVAHIWMFGNSEVHRLPGILRALNRRSVRSFLGALVAQREYRWSRPSRDIRRSVRLACQRHWSVGTTRWIVLDATVLLGTGDWDR